MRTRWIVVTVVVACGLSFLAGRALTDEGGGAPPNMEEMKKVWEALAQTGEHHKRISALKGTWNVKMTYPDMETGKPKESVSTATFTPILGGRFIEQRMVGTHEGKPFEGRMLMGYDNATKQYTAVWIDNHGTGMMHYTGTYDEAAKAMNMKGAMKGPGGTEMTSTDTISFVSDKEFNYESVWHMGPGADMTMKIHYVRSADLAAGGGEGGGSDCR